MDLRKNIVEFFLKAGSRSFSNYRANTNFASRSIDSLKSVVIFSYSKDIELSAIRNFSVKLNDKYKDLTIVIINNSGTLQTDCIESELIISLNDYNLIGRLKKRLRKWINNNKFELLMSFVIVPDLISDSLVKSIQSELKSGYYMAENVMQYDLTIRHTSDNYNDQLFQFEHYLTNLKICK